MALAISAFDEAYTKVAVWLNDLGKEGRCNEFGVREGQGQGEGKVGYGKG